MQIELSAEQLGGLRAIRLYHWRETNHWRRVANNSKDAAFAKTANGYADWHINATAALNDFFPEPGDTAERDDEGTRA